MNRTHVPILSYDNVSPGSRRSLRRHRLVPTGGRGHLEALEPRLLLSGNPAGTVPDLALEAPRHVCDRADPDAGHRT